MSSESTVAKQLVRSVLLANDPLRARVAAVVAGHLRSTEAATLLQTKPLIILETTGGFARYFSALQDVNLDIYCYSKASSDEALDVYDSVFQILQEACCQAANVPMQGIMRELERPLDGWNEQVGAWFARGGWTLKAVS
jgi:hypothetical protein